MKKLNQWIVGVNILCVLWLSLLYEYGSNSSEAHFVFIQFLPIILVVGFGVFSMAIILYRVIFTFNDCKLAAKELQAEIKEAKIALQQKGFKFD